MSRLSFDMLQELDLPLTELVSGRIGFAHDFFLRFPYEVREDLPDESTDLVVLTDKARRSEKIAELAGHDGRVVYVTAPGDSPFRAASVPGGEELPPNFVAAFATSNQLADRRAISVPLGVRSSKLATLQFVRQNRNGPRERLLYANFTLNDEHYRPDKQGRRHIRFRLAEQLRDRQWVTWDISPARRDSAEDLIAFYSQIAAHRFVLSPEGNGIDCYRTWEALYLGAIPIVMVSPAMSAFSELPILFTEDYSELSPAYLERMWSLMSRRSYRIDAMLQSHYFARFLSAVSRLEKPRFICWGFGSEKFLDVLSRSSRSAANVVAETPTPPFTFRDDPMSVSAWHAPGRLRICSDDDALRLWTEGEGPTVVEIPLHTIAGGRFMLTATVRSEPGSGGAQLTVNVEGRPGLLGHASLNGRRVATLEIPFVSRSDRTVLAIRGPESGATESWRIERLELMPDLNR